MATVPQSPQNHEPGRTTEPEGCEFEVDGMVFRTTAVPTRFEVQAYADPPQWNFAFVLDEPPDQHEFRSQMRTLAESLQQGQQDLRRLKAPNRLADMDQLPGGADAALLEPPIASGDAAVAAPEPRQVAMDTDSPPSIVDPKRRPDDRPRTRRSAGTAKPSTDSSRSPKAQLFVTVSHWSMVILLALNLLTGMRLGWGYLESWLGGPTGLWAEWLNAIAPTGTLLGINLITLHVAVAFLMFLVTGVYVGYLLWSKSSRRLRVSSQDIQGIFTELLTGGFWRNKRALWSANVILYWVAFAFIFVLALSGAAIYWPEWGLFQLLGGYGVMRLLHGIAAYLFLPYVILHVALQWIFRGRFWAIFKAQIYRPQIRAGLLSTAAAVLVVGVFYAWSEQIETLTAPHLTGDIQVPVLDGNANDAAWQLAKAVTIRTIKGINEPADHVDVSLKAVHDGEHIYFQVQWPDPDVSAKRYPLYKTAQGWKVLQTAMDTANEDVYYEDKLAMYITDVPNTSCAATCHVGVGPDGVEKGVHYTTNGEVGDVWHWKSVRTEPMYTQDGAPGQMDDQHFRAPDPIPANPKKRYKAGYHADPKSGGGYKVNFTKLDPSKPLAETYVRPIMLPPTNDIKPNPDPATSEEGVTWWIHKSEGIPYSEAADTYPVGSLIPNILITPHEGDRADVWSKAAWRDGQWTLEIRRVLDTKSPYDVAFTSYRPVYLSVGTFNRTQIRHSEHIKPVKLVLQP